MTSIRSPYREIGVSIASVLGDKGEIANRRRERRRMNAKKYKEKQNQGL